MNNISNYMQFVNSPEFNDIFIIHFKTRKDQIIEDIIKADPNKNKVEYTRHDINRLLLEELDFFMASLKLQCINQYKMYNNWETDIEADENIAENIDKTFEWYFWK